MSMKDLDSNHMVYFNGLILKLKVTSLLVNVGITVSINIQISITVSLVKPAS